MNKLELLHAEEVAVLRFPLGKGKVNGNGSAALPLPLPLRRQQQRPPALRFRSSFSFRAMSIYK